VNHKANVENTIVKEKNRVNMKIRNEIMQGETILGIELGSTRIKGVLIGRDNEPVASGSYDWGNRFEDGIWTYHLEDVWAGIQGCYKNLTDNISEKFGVGVERLGAIGISGMMHGYIATDQEGNWLTTFRTWRNTTYEV